MALPCITDYPVKGEPTNVQDETYLEQLAVKGGWGKTQLSVVHDKDSYARIVRSFITTSNLGSCQFDNQREIKLGNSLLSIGSNYAKLAQRSLEYTKAQKQFSSFQLLLWISYITFIEWKGYPSEDIDSVINNFSALDQKRRRRLVPRARKINRVICDIVHVCGWSIARATEVFFLCEFYQKWAQMV